MFSATNESGELITITSANAPYLQKQTNYYCHCCNSKLTIKNGPLKQPHFAHPKGSCCFLHESLSESENHLKGKLDIGKWLLLQGISFHFEKHYPKINRQADIEVEEKNIVEFQCSTVPVHQLIQRTQDYQSLKKQVKWLLGQPVVMKKGYYLLTHFQRAFINFAPNLGYHIIYYSSSSTAFEILYHLTFVRGSRFFGRRLRLPLTLTLPAMKRKLTRIHFKPFSIKKDEKLERERLCYYYAKYKSNHHFMRKIYQLGFCLQNLPEEMGVTFPSQFLTTTPPIEWQFNLGYHFFSRLEKGEFFKFLSLRACFLRHVSPICSIYLGLEELDHLLKQYLLYLEKRGILIEFKHNHFRVTQKFIIKKNSSPYSLF